MDDINWSEAKRTRLPDQTRAQALLKAGLLRKARKPRPFPSKGNDYATGRTRRIG